jgi:hypothetical protein
MMARDMLKEHSYTDKTVLRLFMMAILAAVWEPYLVMYVQSAAIPMHTTFGVVGQPSVDLMELEYSLFVPPEDEMLSIDCLFCN